MCQKVYVRKNALLKHKMIMHKKLNFPCNICEMKFKTKIDLIRHRDRHTEVEEHKNKQKGLSIKTLQTNAVQKSITAFYRKKFWETTEKDVNNKKAIDKSRYKFLPPLGKSFIPRLRAFYVDDGIFGGGRSEKWHQLQC